MISNLSVKKYKLGISFYLISMDSPEIGHDILYLSNMLLKLPQKASMAPGAPVWLGRNARIFIPKLHNRNPFSTALPGFGITSFSVRVSLSFCHDISKLIHTIFVFIHHKLSIFPVLAPTLGAAPDSAPFLSINMFTTFGSRELEENGKFYLIFHNQH